MSEFLGAKTIKKCRAQHPCYWCPEAINIGDKAHRDVWAEEGTVTTIYWHPECIAVADSYAESDPHWEDYEPRVHRRGVPFDEEQANLMGMTTA